MATAAKCVIAEVDKIEYYIDPDQVHTPGVYVHRIVVKEKNSPYSEELIENVTTKDGTERGLIVEVDKATNTLKTRYRRTEKNANKDVGIKEKIIKRAAKEVENGMTINLGIGIPTLLPNYLPKDIEVTLHSENGVLGVGDYPEKGKENPRLINAGKVIYTAKSVNYHNCTGSILFFILLILCNYKRWSS
jgi:3-oxoacid CoA-transferase